jgi:hypothetical protein
VVCPKYFKENKLPSPRRKKAFHQVLSRKHKTREIPKNPYRIWKGLHQAKRPK